MFWSLPLVILDAPAYYRGVERRIAAGEKITGMVELLKNIKGCWGCRRAAGVIFSVKIWLCELHEIVFVT